MLKHSALLTGTLIGMFFLASIATLCRQQTENASRPEFEVASIKPSQPNPQGGGIKPLPGGQTYIATNVPVKLMIKLMFRLNESQIVGGPHWLDTDLYDVNAKADRPESIDELHIMFQNLLIDRFKLQYHMETRMLPAYELMVDKSGEKVTVNDSPEHFDVPIEFTGRGKMQATHCSMSYFTWLLSQMLRRPVVDDTKLTAFYDFKLNWTPEPPPDLGIRGGSGANLAPRELAPANGQDIFTAVREQLGLKLDSQKAPVQVMVIDHVERPSAD